MKKSQHVKSKSFSSANLDFYEAKQTHLTTQTQFENRKGKKQEDTFRRKKKSLCHELNYSSCLNPFARNKYVRYDQPATDTCVKKKKTNFTHNILTDPITLRYQNPQRQIRVKPQFQSSFIYKKQAENRFLLPAQRQFSQNKRRYFTQIGFSYSLQKIPKTRQTQNSSKIKPVLQYAEADHRMQYITPKIGHFNKRK